MPLGPFAILSLFYIAIGVQVVYRLVRSWSAVWDRRFTHQDRGLIDQAAFFVLVPVSVALHELGHAMAIWLMGGEVVDFGFYGFAGYVSYLPWQFTDVEQTIIAAAGSLVNAVLCFEAVGVALVWRPPLRAAINELLLQFAFLSGINAFVVYPLLDLASGLNGDWRQMYDSGVTWLTAIIVAVQAGILAVGYWLVTNDRTRALMASRTAVPPGFERGTFGGIRPSRIDAGTMSPVERTLQEASERVISGWHTPVQRQVHRFDGGSAVVLEWSDGRAGRVAVAARALSSGRMEIVRLHATRPGQLPPPPRVLHAWLSPPGSDQLTIGLRIAMETVEQGG